MKPHTPSNGLAAAPQTALPVSALQVCFNLSVVSAVSGIKHPASPEAVGASGKEGKAALPLPTDAVELQTLLQNF